MKKLSVFNIFLIYHQCRWERWCTWSSKFGRIFVKYLKWCFLDHQGLGKAIYEKTWSQKRCDNVPFYFFSISYNFMSFFSLFCYAINYFSLFWECSHYFISFIFMISCFFIFSSTVPSFPYFLSQYTAFYNCNS